MYPFFLLSTVLLYLVVQLTSVSATAFTYNVAANERACFYTWSDTIGKKIGFYFAVQSGGTFDIDFKVTDPTNKVILDGERERQGDYIFTARHIGEYEFCFLNEMSTFTDKLVDFEVSMELELRRQKMQGSSSSSGLSLTPLEESMITISDTLTSISRVQKHLRTREHRNSNTVSSTEKRILWFATLESLAIVVMAGLQVFVIQSFFNKVRRGGV